ncbi:gastrula zinc finger protein XlCGF26.1-like [Asterias rubens]|uniref:gastrula zinc finger protein XlCGF26.1-like n=1 Tax=Asterias rubens TaxID=7604 RepID=UPI001455918A|nr:gastrula zinc finger protein XlCGF26.1-like [Asterias rubens]
MAEPLSSLGLMPNQEVVEDVVVIVNNQANQDGTSICTETNAGIAGDSIDVVSDVVNNVVVRTECVPHEVEITSEDLGHLSNQVLTERAFSHGDGALITQEQRGGSDLVEAGEKQVGEDEQCCQVAQTATSTTAPFMDTSLMSTSEDRMDPELIEIAAAIKMLTSMAASSKMTFAESDPQMQASLPTRTKNKSEKKLNRDKTDRSCGSPQHSNQLRKSNRNKPNRTSPMFTHHRTSRPYKCSQCDHSYKKSSYLTRHMKSHEQLSLTCRYCDKKFYANNMRVRHEKHHQVPFRCMVCGKGYGDQAGLVVHIRKHTNEKPFSCKECNCSFTSNSAVLRHERTHLGLKPYVCNVCGKAYTQINTLNDHKKTHFDKWTFACTTCGKVFNARSSLRRHRVKHHPEVETPSGRKYLVKVTTPEVVLDQSVIAQYQCRFCEKTYEKKDSHRKHEKLHTEPERFTCSFCRKVFTGRQDQVVHERTHTGERPFRCELCIKAFSCMSALKRHVKSHSLTKAFECGHCHKTFTRGTGLRDHELIHAGHSKRFPCQYCDKIFASRCAMRSHMTKKHCSTGEDSITVVTQYVTISSQTSSQDVIMS